MRREFIVAHINELIILDARFKVALKGPNRGT